MATIGPQAMTEFCEQMNPAVLLTLREREMRRERLLPEMLRVQESWAASAERRVLFWLAERTPQWIGPDHLTVLGLAAQLGAGLCYALSARNRFALLGVIVCLALNWLWDSIDGTLGPVPHGARPRDGVFFSQ